MNLFQAMNVEEPQATVSPVVAASALPLFASALIREQHEEESPRDLYPNLCRSMLRPNGSWCSMVSRTINGKEQFAVRWGNENMSRIETLLDPFSWSDAATCYESVETLLENGYWL
jgi:hypothetical protein